MIKIPLEILTLEDGSYHLLIAVLLNGELSGKMVVDTGASKTVIDRVLPLGLDDSQELPYTSGIGGEVPASFTQIASLTLGDFFIENVPLAMIDLSAVNAAYEQASQQRILGLLGSDLLLKYHAKIDYKAACLYLEC